MPKSITHMFSEERLAAFGFAATVTLRCLFFSLFVFLIDHLITLGTSPYGVSLGAVGGVTIASLLARRQLKHIGFLLSLLAAYLLYLVLFTLLDFYYADPGLIFKNYNLGQHAEMILLAALAAAAGTWCFWKFKHALTAEVLFLGAAFIYLFSGHRNYRFDMVTLVNNLAWQYGTSQLAMLVIIGAAVYLLLFIYTFCATLASMPRLSRGEPLQIVHREPANLLGGLLLLTIGILLLYFISYQAYERHFAVAGLLTQNGVGSEKKEGLSPLTFQSALGSSNQPAALVRLEGDYRENPFSPMLYLRESALSQFNGHELVLAGPGYDKDALSNTPGQSYTGQEDTDGTYRVPVTQSVYLLADHKLSFGIDYPLSITPLKTPANTSKFRGAFRVYSMAPAFDPKDLKDMPVGDPRWSDEERKHYLAANPDPRYLDLAQNISAEAKSPVDKALAVSTYLSKNAIYTLAPNHRVAPEEDPVVPFLFGDLRGYCVHFAHATAYLLRALGIPARIATGYLTDLSQSKDGHILLRMSDRHAWAEVYVQGLGWLPFDIKPEHVESHAETPVDAKMLEELMGLLGPDEEILPKDAAKGEANVTEESKIYIPTLKDTVLPLGTMVLVIALVKLFFLFAWILPAAPQRRLKRAYRGRLTLLYDMGLKRRIGETREEFRSRVSHTLGLDLLAATTTLNSVNYGKEGGSVLSGNDVQALMTRSRMTFRKVPRLKRLVSLLNPSSVLSGLGGWKW